MRTEFQLSDKDEWFVNTMICIINSQVNLVNKGEQSSINYEYILNWISEHTNAITQKRAQMYIELAELWETFDAACNADKDLSKYEKPYTDAPNEWARHVKFKISDKLKSIEEIENSEMNSNIDVGIKASDNENIKRNPENTHNNAPSFLVAHLIGNSVDAADTFISIAKKRLELGKYDSALQCMQDADKCIEDAKYEIDQFRKGKYDNDTFRQLILKRIDIIKQLEKGFPRSVMKWANLHINAGEKSLHISDVVFTGLDDEMLIDAFEKIIKRFHSQC